MHEINKASRFRNDVAWSAAGTAVPSVLGALVIPLLLHYLTSASFTIFTMCAALITFAPALDLGVSRVAFRYMSTLQNSDQRSRNRFAQDCLTRAWKIGGGVGIALVVCALIINQGYGPAFLASTWRSSSLSFICAALGVPLAIVTNTQRSLLEGLRQFSNAAFVRIGLGVLSALIPVALAQITGSVEPLVLSLVLMRATAYVLQARMLRRLGITSHRKKTIAGYSYEGFWKESLWFALLGMLGLMMSGFDRFIFAWVGGVTLDELAMLLAPQEIALKIITLPAAFVPALIVRIALKSACPEENRRLINTIFWSILVAGLTIAVVASSTATVWVSLLFPSFDSKEAALITKILIVGIVSNAIAQFPFANLVGKGLIKKVAICHSIELPLFIVAVCVLVKEYGVVAAAACWSGRIVLDTALMLKLSDACIPVQGVKNWQYYHILAVVLIGATALGL